MKRFASSGRRILGAGFAVELWTGAIANDGGVGMSGVEGVLENPGQHAKRKAAAGSGWYAVLARTGLVAKGLS